MSVSGVSSGDNSYWQSMQSTNTQRRQDVKALSDALNNGDLSAAQSAFANLKSLGGPQPPQASSSQPSQGSAANPLQSLASALQSGDLAGAQAAFATLEKNHGMHRHHGHHGGPGMPPPPGGDSTQPAPADSTSGGDPATQTGSTLNVTA
jgi:hypothetical protein